MCPTIQTAEEDYKSRVDIPRARRLYFYDKKFSKNIIHDVVDTRSSCIQLYSICTLVYTPNVVALWRI